jgi:hypothetical protein
MSKPTDSEVWDAVKDVLEDEKKPLEVWRVAKAAEMTEGDVIGALIRETLNKRQPVRFRYPPHPRAAITGIGDLFV